MSSLLWKQTAAHFTLLTHSVTLPSTLHSDQLEQPQGNLRVKTQTPDGFNSTDTFVKTLPAIRGQHIHLFYLLVTT